MKPSRRLPCNFVLAQPAHDGSLELMKNSIYIPRSCPAAEKHLSFALQGVLQALNTEEFVRSWCAVSFLYPGLHPDGFASRGSGWPKRLKPIAVEAWRRFKAGELTDNQLYCYQASKAGISAERNFTGFNNRSGHVRQSAG
jgi:hypothetical protein